MNDIQKWYEKILAQMAADSYLDSLLEPSFDFKDEADLRARLGFGANHYDDIDSLVAQGKALSATRMTEVMAQDFIDTWEVIDQLPNTASGFSATVLKHKVTGAYTLSFRSTESKSSGDGGDVERDSSNGANGQISEYGFAWGQLRDMEAYYTDLKAGNLRNGSPSDGAAVAAWLAGAENRIGITGYSLGGHLAQVFSLIHGVETSETVTFNGAGFGAIDGFDVLTEYGDAIAERIDLINAVINKPYEFLDNVTADEFFEIGFGTTAPDGTQATRESLAALLKTREFAGAYERIYDDPLFQYALRVLPDDTTGAFEVSVDELTGSVYEQITPNAPVTNLFGNAMAGARYGENVVAGSGQITGAWVPLYIEDQPLLASKLDLWPITFDTLLKNFGPTHSIALMADSLAVMQLYAAIDPHLLDIDLEDLSLPDDAKQPGHRLNRLIAAMTADRARLLVEPRGEGATLETALDALGRLVVGDTWAATPSSDANGSYADIGRRDTFYSSVAALRAGLFDGDALKAQYQGLAVTPLVDIDAATLAARAADDIAYRYALTELIPFVITGNSTIYARHNTPDPAGVGVLDASQFSDAYLFDRARFLENKIAANESSGSLPGGAAFVTREAQVEFYDAALATRLFEVRTGDIAPPASDELLIENTPGPFPLVGFANSGLMSGRTTPDRLYGNFGNNVLLGYAGTDKLEGGNGNDTLYGNDKSNADDAATDILKGGRGTDEYHAGFGDNVDDFDGLGSIKLRNDLLEAGYREIGDAAGTYTSKDRRYSYRYDEIARVLTVTVKDGDPSKMLTIENFSSGDLGIRLNENPQPTDTQFEGSAGSDTITVNPSGTQISGIIRGAAINPVETFAPNVTVIAALGGDDLITVQGDIAGIRIHGDSYGGTGIGDGHDDIAVDVKRVTNGVIPTDLGAGARVYGGDGNDIISGGQRGDALLGDAGNDRISGNYGDDRISGGEDDRSPTGTDNDVLTGESGNDELFGHAGDDALFGGQGADTLHGGSGNDALYGDLISWGYHVADFSAWSGPSNTRSDGGVYRAMAGAGAALATPNVAGTHVVFEAAADDAGGDDDLDGGEGDDHLLGGQGDDELDGGADRDLLEGEAGNDRLSGGKGNDILYGDISPITFHNHSRVLRSGTASDGNWTLSFREFSGGADSGGNDTLDGGAGTDILLGGVGDDILDGGRFDRAVDVLYGGAGNDDYRFGFGDGRTFVYDTDGDADRVVFRAGLSPDDVHLKPDETGSNLVISLTLNGVDLGDELIVSHWYRGKTVELFTFESGLTWATAFVESETGRNIDDTDPVGNDGVLLAATDQADVSLGDSGNNEVYLLAGEDWFAGGSGNDRVFGGTGNDDLQGNDGDDLISGEAGDDQLFGQNGNDSLYGGSGDDALTGGDGADLLIGGADADKLLGGLDNDTYRFNRGDGNDFIRDDGGIADRIVFGADITANDVTVDAGGNAIILDVRTNGELVGDRITIVDGFLSATEVEAFKFVDGTFWTTADITARLPDAFDLYDGIEVTGGANVTTYTLATRLDDGFTIAINDSGGVDTIDLKVATSGSGRLTPVLNRTLRSGDDLLLDVTVDSTISTIPDAAGEIRIKDFYTDGGFIETIRFGAAEMNAENEPPVLATPPDDDLIALDTPYSFTLPPGTFTDSAFDKLTLSAALADGSDLPGWLTFDPASATFSGAPAFADEAIIDVAITATDTRGLTATTHYGLNVGNVNVAPLLTAPIINQSAVEGGAFSFSLAAGTFMDVNQGDTLTVSAQLASGDPLPTWLAFDDQTNTFSGIPGTAGVGLQLVEVTATDSGSLTATDIFAINVDYQNDAPAVVTAPVDQQLTEQQTFSYTLPAGTFTDSDAVHGDTLDYSLSMQNGTALPGWLLFDETTLSLSGRPVGIFADTDVDVRVTATDTDGASAGADITLEVTDVAGAAAWYVPHETIEVGSDAYSRSGSVTTALSNGGYVVVWESADRDGDERGIFAQRYTGSGAAVGAVTPVNTTTVEDQRALAVAALADGGFVVSWVSLHEDDGNQVPPLNDGGGIYAQLFAADGTPSGVESRVNHVFSGIQNQTAIASLSDGGYMITWFSQFNEQRFNNGEYGIGDPGFFGQRYDASGNAVAGAVRLADAGISKLEPSVAGLLGDGFVMVWTGTDGDGAGIRAQRYFSGGVKNGSEIAVNSWVDDLQADPRVAALATGGFVVIWRSEDQDFSGGGIYGQRYSGTGAAQGNEFRVNNTTSGSQGDPGVTATPDGGFVVSWVSSVNDGIGDVYARQYDAAGRPTGTETLIAASAEQDAPSITALTDGSLVHTWTATDAGGVSTNPPTVWELGGPTRIESARIELRANTPLELLRPAVSLAGAEFRSIFYRVEGNIFFDPDLPYGDSVMCDAALADGSELPAWLAFDSTTGALSGVPLSGQAGTFDVRITAADLSGAVGESIVTIDVSAAADVTVTALPGTYTVNGAEPLFNSRPDSAVLTDGSRIVVWDSTTEVRARRLAADGAPIGGEFRVDIDASNARVTALTDGGFVVAWRRSGGKIYGRRFDAAGLPTVGEIELVDASATNFADLGIAKLPDDGFVVAWSVFSAGSNGHVMVRPFSGDAMPTQNGGDLTIGANLSGSSNVAVARASDGFVVSWDQLSADGERVILARRYSVPGSASGGVIEVSHGTGLASEDPAVTGLADGSFLVTWTANDGVQDDVFARLFEASGVPRGNAWRVNNYTNSEQRYSTATATNDGGFVIAWHSETWTAPNEYGFMQAQHFDRDGNPTGDFFSVGLESTMRDTGPSITAAAEGGFDIVWESDHGAAGAATDSIKGRHFNVEGSVPNLLPVVSTPIADQTISEDTPYRFFVPADTVLDPDGAGRITYRATLAGGAALPGWLSFNTTTRAFSGSPTDADVGTYAISVVGSDTAGEAVAELFTLTVDNVNDVPVAADDIAGLRLDVGDRTITLDVLANDTDIDAGDDVTTFSLDTVTVAGGLGRATVVGNQLHFDAGTDFDNLAAGEVRQAHIHYTMSDVAGASSAAVATVAVHNGEVVVSDNRANIVNVTSPKTLFGPGTFRFGLGSSGSSVNIGRAFGLGTTTIGISDQTGTVGIRRSTGSGIPGRGTIDATGLQLAKSRTGLGSMLITFEGTDVAIHIEDFDPNDVFADDPLIDRFIFDGVPYTYTEFVSRGFDLDGTPKADAITGTNTVDRILGFGADDTLLGADGDDTITGGPGDDFLDGGNGNDTYVFTAGDGHDVITDAAGSDRIVFTSGLTSADAVSSRVDNDLQITLSSTDSLTLKDWYLGPQYRIETFVFADDNLRIVEPDTAETIHENHAPTVAAAPSDQNAIAGAEFLYPIDEYSFADVDLDETLTYSAKRGDGSPLPAWLAFDADSREFSGTPSVDDIGSLTIRITATDSGGLSVSNTFLVAIAAAPGKNPPTIANEIPDQSVAAGAVIDYSIPSNTFADLDPDDSLILSASRADGSALPDWFLFNAVTGSFAGTLPADAGGVTVRVTAVDRSGLSVSDSFVFSLTPSTNTITGTVLDDTLTGTAAADEIFGLAGNDAIDGGDSDDLIFAGSGDDRVIAMGGNNEIHGGSNDDTILTGAGNDTIYGNRHNDSIDAGDGANTVYGGRGNDYISAGDGADRIDGGRGNDVLNPGRGDDVVFGGHGRDTIVDLDGNNEIHGGSNSDTIKTGAGNDTIYGGKHHDRITAGDGNDKLFGGRGADTLLAGAGDDWVGGGSGSDFIRGGRGDDTLAGGRGGDTYHFERLDGTDVVLESNSSRGDAVEFGPGITVDQIWFSRAGDDLRLGFPGTADTVFVQDWYTQKATIERFEVDDGSYLVDSDVEQLVHAMAAFGSPAGSESSLPQPIAQEIASVIAAVWQSPA